MEAYVVIAVLGAAALHAAWNVIAKAGVDKTLSVTAVVLGHVPFALLVLPFVPLPAVDSLPYLVLGAVLHTAYQLALARAYRLAPMSIVYPVSRGAAPLIVVAVTVWLPGQALQPGQLLAVGLICAAVLGIAPLRGKPDRKAVLTALAVAVFIAGYSLVDGTGARTAGTALGFYAWESILNAVLLTVIVCRQRGRAPHQLLRGQWGRVVLGGGASFVAYAIVIWAFTQAPIALVTALRETSILFALGFATLVLGEPLGKRKLISVGAAVAGVLLLRLAA